MSQIKEQDKNTWGRKSNETETNNLPDKKFKAIVIRMPIEQRKE